MDLRGHSERFKMEIQSCHSSQTLRWLSSWPREQAKVLAEWVTYGDLQYLLRTCWTCSPFFFDHSHLLVAAQLQLSYLPGDTCRYPPRAFIACLWVSNHAPLTSLQLPPHPVDPLSIALLPIFFFPWRRVTFSHTVLVTYMCLMSIFLLDCKLHKVQDLYLFCHW